MLKLSIVVLSWNTENLLEQSLTSIFFDLKGFENYEVIVVDNGSVDGSVEMTKNKFPRAKLIINKKNLGFSKANNIAIAKAKGEYVMLLNSDTIVEKDSILKLVSCFEKQPGARAISPLILNKDMSVQEDPVYLKYPSIATALFYYNPVFKQLLLKKPLFHKLIFNKIDIDGVRDVEQFSGAAVMFKKKLFREIGYFDENFPFYFEDSDFSKRILEFGRRIIVCPQSKIIHFGGQSMKKQTANQDNFFYYKRNFASLFLFCQKHYSKTNYFLIKALMIVQWFIGTVIYFILSIFSSRFKNSFLTYSKLFSLFTLNGTKVYSKW